MGRQRWRFLDGVSWIPEDSRKIHANKCHKDWICGHMASLPEPTKDIHIEFKKNQANY
jgi:hypothetical protein